MFKFWSLNFGEIPVVDQGVQRKRDDFVAGSSQPIPFI